MMTRAWTGPDRPTIDSDTEAWWDAAQRGQLMVNTCRSCLRSYLYARPFCPHCWSDDVHPQPASGKARLYTWSVVHQNAAPFAEHTPYIVAMVDLDEGPRLMTIIENCPPEHLRAGMPLVVAFREGGDGFVVPVFGPD